MDKTTKLIIWGAGLVIAFVAAIALRNYLRAEQAEEEKITAQNELAKGDSLRTVLQGSHGILQERYAQQHEELNDLLGDKQFLLDHLKKTQATVRFLSNELTEVKISGKTIPGKKDSTNTILDFDSTDQHFTFFGTVDTKIPSLTIHTILLYDSSSVGIYEQRDGMVRGFVTHSNPYISDATSTEFFLKIGEGAPQTSPITDWLRIGGALLTGYGAGTNDLRLAGAGAGLFVISYVF